MIIFQEEIVATNASTPVQLNRALYDVVGGTRAAGARIVVKTAPIYYGFITTPTALNGYKAAVDTVIEIDGYDNIRDFRAVTQSGTGTLYVNYAY